MSNPSPMHCDLLVIGSGAAGLAAAVTVAHHQLLAHGLALQAMRAERSDLQLGIVINPSNIRSDEQRPAPLDELHLIDAMHNRWWFDATLRGEYPPELLTSFERLADAIQPGASPAASHKVAAV